MAIIIKQMETEAEVRGKAYVHWYCWHTVYAGLVDQAYLEQLTLEKMEEKAFRSMYSVLVAKEGDRVVGFIGYGKSEEAGPEAGEIFTLYVLPAYFGTGLGLRLMNAALELLQDYRQIRVWLLKENKRAYRFYQKCGFTPDGNEKLSKVGAVGIRMTLDRGTANL